MSETRTEALVGAAVLAAAVGFLIYAAQLTGFDTGPRGGDGYDRDCDTAQVGCAVYAHVSSSLRGALEA